MTDEPSGECADQEYHPEAEHDWEHGTDRGGQGVGDSAEHPQNVQPEERFEPAPRPPSPKNQKAVGSASEG